MVRRIHTPIRTHEDFGHSISRLIKIVGEINYYKDSEILLDFSGSRMLNPFFLGGLACVIQGVQNAGGIITSNHDQNPYINSYLSTIHFPLAHSTNSNQEEAFLNSLNWYSGKRYIPIIRFQTGAAESITIVRNRCLTAVVNLLRGQLGFSGIQITPLSYFLSELTDNINDHSNAPEGYVFAQYYPGSNYLDLCICDYGQGILQSYINNPKFTPRDEEDAMQLALSGFSTKDRAEARGFGISRTRTMLTHGLRGKLFIWSGNTAFLQTVDEEVVVTYEGNAYFQGTFLALRLPTITPGAFNFYSFIE